MEESTIPILLDEVWKSSLQQECPSEISPEIWEQWRSWEKLPANDFIAQFHRGLKGQNIGLGNGLKNINKYIYGTHMARYYLIGADSGVGKTTISDFMFILKGWEEAKRLKRKFKVFYCSFEISKPDKIARWVSYYIFVKFGIRLPSDYVMGRIEGKLPTKHEKIILIAYSAVIEMMRDISFVDIMIHPTKIFEDLITHHYEKHGTVLRDEISKEETKKGKKGFIKGFRMNKDSENMMTILMIDHMALTAHEMGLDTKGTMDKLSRYAVVLKNMFQTTICAIQQFSTDMLSANRTMLTKKTEGDITPTRLDFGDSKTTFRDAEVVIAYVRPNKELSEFMGYNLDKHEGLGDCMIAQYLMKNRYGVSNKVLPLFLDGCTGYVYDLPLEPSNMIAMQPWYNRNQEIEAICQEFCPVIS